jgi:hypothetical protein
MAGSGLACVVTLWIVGLLIPAETMLPDVPTVLVADGCHAAAPHVEAASNPELSDRLVTVVVSESMFGGSELSDFNCEMLVQRVRAAHPGMRLVPRRAICHRIRAWANARLEALGRTPGQITWIVDGEALAKTDEHPVLTQLGIEYKMLADGGYRLVSTR